MGVGRCISVVHTAAPKTLQKHLNMLAVSEIKPGGGGEGGSLGGGGIKTEL